MRQTIPRRTPTRNFMVSGGANGYYTLLKGDPEVVVAKGNLIIPRRNSTTGRSFMSYPGQLYYYYYHYYLSKNKRTFFNTEETIPVSVVLIIHFCAFTRSIIFEENLRLCNIHFDRRICKPPFLCALGAEYCERFHRNGGLNLCLFAKT